MIKKFDDKRKELKPYGLTCERWQPNLMTRPDRHNEIEINYLPSGSITYLVNHRKFTVDVGSIVVFWALLPHQIVDFTLESPYYVVTIPFSKLSHWNFPKVFLNNVFKGEIQFLRNLEDADLSNKLFSRWSEELNSQNQNLHHACELEIYAFLKRFANSVQANNHFPQRLDSSLLNLVEKMTVFIAINFTQSIGVKDIADEVGLHPDYANAIFKKSFNTSLSSYLIQQRVLHAQRELITTSDSITSIAYKSGFHSISRFNASFKKYNGMTPRNYRSQMKLI